MTSTILDSSSNKNPMKKITLYLIIGTLIAGFYACSTPEEKLQKQIKPLAKEFLDSNDVAYKFLEIKCIDTVTELGYANMNCEFLTEMENSYQSQYYAALANGDSSTSHYLSLYLRDIIRTKEDFEDLMENGDLKSTGVLLYLVTGNFKKDKEDEEGEDFMFFVNQDKKSIHVLDPFADNLLYKDEEP